MRAGAAKLSARLKTKPQSRLDGFFTITPGEPKKRKADDKKDAKKKAPAKRGKK